MPWKSRNKQAKCQAAEPSRNGGFTLLGQITNNRQTTAACQCLIHTVGLHFVFRGWL